MLRITEIFHSIQGESNTVGMPTVFIRLTGCPLRCTYCDTEYAFFGGERVSIDDIVAQTRQYATPYVTVTGGEPLAQKKCPELLDRLLQEGFHVALETSGAIDISVVDPNVTKVMDLKTPSSGEQQRNRYDNLEYLDKKDQVKFVVADREDYEWSKGVLKKYSINERCEVLFSPVADRCPPGELADYILSDQLPVRFQIQLHKILWGDIAGR